MLEAAQTLPQLGELVERGLCAAAAIEQRVDLLHELTQLAQLRQASGDEQESFAFAWLQATLDKQVAVLKQIMDFLLDGFAFSGGATCGFVFRRRSAAL